nr:CRISPR system precrRNA processing endoribonuclease RAMP protein Cas6 [Candidatus Sigynarchaeota archaeon]
MVPDHAPATAMNQGRSITGYRLHVRCKSISSGIYRPDNHSDVHGMILSFMKAHDEGISAKMHEHGTRKPWSFSRIFFDIATPVPESRWFHVREGIGGQFFINTTSEDVYTALVSGLSRHIQSRLNDIALELMDIDCETTDLATVTPVPAITMVFHTPTFFREYADAQITTEFDLGKLIRFQCLALTRAEMAFIDPDRLLKNVTVGSKLLKPATGMLHEKDKNIVWPGFVGEIELCCTATDPAIIKDFVTMAIGSQFIGVGSRTSIGFGHVTVKSLNEKTRASNYV